MKGSTEDPARLVDSFRSVFPSPAFDEATFHDFTGRIQGSRIDFVFSSPALKPLAAGIDRLSHGGRYASDHYPVWAELQWETVPQQ